MSLKLSDLMLYALLEVLLLESGEHPKKPRAGREGPTLRDLRAKRGTLTALVGRKLLVRVGEHYRLTGNGVMVAKAFYTGHAMGSGPKRLDMTTYVWSDTDRLHSEVMAERFPNGQGNKKGVIPVSGSRWDSQATTASTAGTRSCTTTRWTPRSTSG